MKIFVMRYGQEIETVRGGWSSVGLTEEGIVQVETTANSIVKNQRKFNIKKIISSDLQRAKQSAYIVADRLELDVEFNSDFREINNGDFADMKNEIADKLYPNLYYRTLEFDEHYPNGESPKEFYTRVKSAWLSLVETEFDGNILLVTHGGVINIIKSIIDGKDYSNKEQYIKSICGEIAFIKEADPPLLSKNIK